MAAVEEPVKRPEKKSFFKSGHFFRDFSLLLIFAQLINEFMQVWSGFDSMTYATVILTMAVGQMWPFAIKMSWCLLLIGMFTFTLGGTTRWPLTLQIFITIAISAKYALFGDYVWAGAQAATIIVYYAAVKEVRRREIRHYVADLLPDEKETPLWVMILVFLAFNGIFTYPAWNKYSERLKELDIDYRQMISDMVDQVVERIIGEKSAVLQSLDEFSGKMQKMMEEAGKAIDMSGIMDNIQQGTNKLSEAVKGLVDSDEMKMMGDYFQDIFSGVPANRGAISPSETGSYPALIPEPAPARKIHRPQGWE